MGLTSTECVGVDAVEAVSDKINQSLVDISDSELVQYAYCVE